MVNLDLIELADFTRPTEIIDEIINQNPQIQIPIPLDDIAYKSGITDIQYRKLDAFEGLLQANKEKSEGVIFVNNNLNNGTKQRQRFTLGHEIGHFMLPFHGNEMKCTTEAINTQNKHDKIELEASQFSSQILMPRKLFCRNQYFDANASIFNVLKLAEWFNVSFEACLNRYVETHHEPLMALYFKDKRFRYFRTNKHQPFYLSQRPTKGSSPPFGSLTSQLNLKRQDYNSEDLIDTSTWFSSKEGFMLPENIIEDVYVQKNGYSVTLLKFEDEIEECET